MSVVCEMWVRDGDRLLHIDPKFFRPKQHFFLILAGVAQPWITEGRKLSVWKLILTLASCPQLSPTPTDSSRLCSGYIFVWHPPASAAPPLIYTGASLDWRLGRGLICYNHLILIFQNSTCGIFFLHVHLHPPLTHFTNNAQGQQQ